MAMVWHGIWQAYGIYVWCGKFMACKFMCGHIEYCIAMA